VLFFKQHDIFSQEEKRMHSTHESINPKGVILLVDDDEIVLEVGGKMLQHLGYEVLKARDGQEALTVFDKHHNRVDVIILDMRLPGMNGDTVFGELRKINAHTKVLLASGYFENHLSSVILDKNCNDFIQKPFNLQHLNHKLEKLIEN